MNEEFLEQHEIGMMDEYHDELLREGVDDMQPPIPTWFYILLFGGLLIIIVLIIGMSLGTTRTITETVTETVYVSDSGLSEKIDQLTERLDIAERPHDDNYKLCSWSDFDCEEGVDYIEKEWWEKE